ncbi:arylesterase [Leptospira ilyithenensis]|uniref:Arylesterase n=1 Tax=Leptospira ilyithenensis TaxID=2484901 RepID=A0A4R9LRG6_9LEPT|nr:arylesterase [Leptospira ilyithenensis]TGN11113.1 arylesterase [Leptospira ilyithenensis]
MFRFHFIFVAIFISFAFSCSAQVQKKPIEGCFRIAGVPGPEDIELVSANGKPNIIISSHDRRNMESIGGLFIFDPNSASKEEAVTLIKTNYPENFRPHGFSYARVKGRDTLAVISHTLRKVNPHTVEIFEHDGKVWIHKKTLEDESLTSPNDLFLTESGEIFVSNDHGSPGKTRQFWDLLIRNGRADIAYYDGNKFYPLDKPVLLGNGILIRKEAGIEKLYRSVFWEQALFVYEVQRNQNGFPNLKYLKKISIGSGPDNIIQDEKGDLWVASHISTWRFLKHASDKDNLSPSQIFRIDGKTNETFEVYANEGEEISASSTGLPFKNKLYISQVFEDFILSCPKP